MPVRLLLVDDEAALAELLKKYLERLGYEVDLCLTPDAALALFRENPRGYALVLTDLTLPGMSGVEMLDRMRAIDPQVTAILSSGYPHTFQAARVTFLQKPFLPKALAALVEDLLKTKPPA